MTKACCSGCTALSASTLLKSQSFIVVVEKEECCENDLL